MLSITCLTLCGVPDLCAMACPNNSQLDQIISREPELVTEWLIDENEPIEIVFADWTEARRAKED